MRTWSIWFSLPQHTTSCVILKKSLDCRMGPIKLLWNRNKPSPRMCLHSRYSGRRWRIHCIATNPCQRWLLDTRHIAFKWEKLIDCYIDGVFPIAGKTGVWLRFLRTETMFTMSALGLTVILKLFEARPESGCFKISRPKTPKLSTKSILENRHCNKY